MVICAAMVNFLGNIFLTSYLLFLSATFSLPFESFGADCFVLVLAACFFGDLVKNDIMEGYFTSLSLGIGSNGDSSQSCIGFPLTFALVYYLSGIHFLGLGSTSRVLIAQFESSNIGGDSISCVDIDLATCCFFQTTYL